MQMLRSPRRFAVSWGPRGRDRPRCLAVSSPSRVSALPAAGALSAAAALAPVAELAVSGLIISGRAVGIVLLARHVNFRTLIFLGSSVLSQSCK